MIKEYSGKEFEIRPLTRGELKTLRKKGFTLGALDVSNIDDAIDEIIGIILGEEKTKELDALPNNDSVAMYQDILKLTFGGDPEKNSLKSGEASAPGA